MTGDEVLDVAQLGRVIELAAARLTGGFRPEAAVALAADLVAEGVDSSLVLALAVLPADPAVLRIDEVGPLFDEMCESLNVEVAVPGEAGWHRARSLASAIVAGTLPPGQGAAHLWPLWEQCGSVPGSDPLDMLQLFEEWEGSVGRPREQAEQRIVASARSVVRDADRALAAMALPGGFIEGCLRPIDVMPLLLRSCPSFLHDWYEIEDEHEDSGNEGGRLGFLDAGAFAQHLVELRRQNNRAAVESAFRVIERMHAEGDDYVRELVTIGYLEGVQNVAGHAEIDPFEFVPYLGPESARWWRGLDAFWSGKRPRVEPD